MSMKALLENHLELLRVRHFSPDTVKGRRHSIQMFFTHLETSGVADLREVTRDTIQDYQLALMRRYPSPTVRHHMSSLRQFFAQLENTDAILLNPTAGVPLPKWERRLPKRILTPAEVRKLLNAPDETPKGLRDRAMLELFYSSGIRREEMARSDLAGRGHKKRLCARHGQGQQGTHRAHRPERVRSVGQVSERRPQRMAQSAAQSGLDGRALAFAHPAPRADTQGSRRPHHLPICPPYFRPQRVAARLAAHLRHASGRPTARTSSMCSGCLGTNRSRPPTFIPASPCTDLKKMLQRTHPRTGDAAATAAVTCEDAAQMPGGLRHDHNSTPNL